MCDDVVGVTDEVAAPGEAVQVVELDAGEALLEVSDHVRADGDEVRDAVHHGDVGSVVGDVE
jgi:hypothetical protein